MWIFKSRISYSHVIHDEVKAWVRTNINKWREEDESWFDIDLLPDEFLPLNVVAAEGGPTQGKPAPLAGGGE